jgi:hypothetical protein
MFKGPIALATLRTWVMVFLMGLISEQITALMYKGK